MRMIVEDCSDLSSYGEVVVYILIVGRRPLENTYDSLILWLAPQLDHFTIIQNHITHPALKKGL